MTPPPAHRRTRIRMYRQGLGDCFLLTLPGPGGLPFRMLIDCGVLLGTPGAEALLKRVAQDICKETWDPRARESRLDIVIATHEHWDHVSGFLQARDEFDRMTIGEVWMAWTEDPADDLAQVLRTERRETERALRVLARKMSAAAGPVSRRLGMLVGFFGAGRVGRSTSDALDCLVNHPSRPRVRYFRPGGPPVLLGGSGAARAYVLGPPRDTNLLRCSRPIRTGAEVYELTPARSLFLGAGLSLDDVGDLADLSHAFEPHVRLRPQEAEALPFFRDHYGRPGDPMSSWRRIDQDWVEAAEQVALQLDGHTNNTSLALAFELEAAGRILLFPGDAQVGNWQSWKDCTWEPNGRGEQPVTAADLLARTVVYKVSHHASHNATLRAEGLEQMLSPDLVAMIPVDQRLAAKLGWNMPFPGLLRRLTQRTQGRILRADLGLPEWPSGMSRHDWERFRNAVHVDPSGLYLEFTLPD